MYDVSVLGQAPIDFFGLPTKLVSALWRRQVRPTYAAELLMRDEAGFMIQKEDIVEAPLARNWGEARYELEVSWF